MFMSLFVFSKVIHAMYRLQKATLHIILRDTHQGQKYLIELRGIRELLVFIKM